MKKRESMKAASKDTKDMTHVAGKRKRAVARVSVRKGSGIVRVNNLRLEAFQPAMARMKIMEPLQLAGNLTKEVDITITMHGGGIMGQAESARLGVARALVNYTGDAKLEKTFLDYDRHLLVADVRRKEVAKPNVSKARAKRQKSYR